MRRLRKLDRSRKGDRSASRRRKPLDAETVTFSDVFWSLDPRARMGFVGLLCLVVFYIFLGGEGGGFSQPAQEHGSVRHGGPVHQGKAADAHVAAPKVDNADAAAKNASSEPAAGASADRPADTKPSLEEVGAVQHETKKGQGADPMSLVSDLLAEASSVQANQPSDDLEGSGDFTWLHPKVPSATRSCFTFGNKNDHMASFSPVCLETQSRQLIGIMGGRICSGSMRDTTWLFKNCDNICDSAAKDALFTLNGEETPDWLAEQESKNKVQWIEGTTILQMLERNCGNIAHYAGRIFFAHHVLSNPAAYVKEGLDLTHYVLLPGVDAMKRFQFAERYAFWHKKVLEAMVFPSVPEIMSMDALVERLKGSRSESGLKVLLLDDAAASSSQYICFRQAVIPGYLKGRYFVDDKEYPSREDRSAAVKDAPPLPRDAVKLRSRIGQVLRGSADLAKPQRKLVFLDRAQAAAARRAVNPESKTKLFSMLQDLATRNNFTFEAVAFDDLSFVQQEEAMREAAIAVGVHGANLVNCIFQPSLTALVELMPYGFEHDMYVEAGRAGIKYYTHQMSTGEEFPGRSSFPTVMDCINHNHDCKVHYRDATLTFTETDYEKLKRILTDAFSYLASLEAGGSIAFGPPG